MLWVLGGTPAPPDPRAGTQKQPGPTWSSRAVQRRGRRGMLAVSLPHGVPECPGIPRSRRVGRGRQPQSSCCPSGLPAGAAVPWPPLRPPGRSPVLSQGRPPQSA